MKIVVIGGCGHIGSYLIPKLVRANHRVICVSRGKSKPYTEDFAWKEVEPLILDREQEPLGTFDNKIAALNADVVVDLISFSLASVQHMVEALRHTNLSHYLYCSSIWTHGRTTVLPLTEDLPRHPLDEYGEQKYQSEQYLHQCFRNDGFPETVVMPGQISGPGWNIINPVGNLDRTVFAKIRRGEEIVMPNFGMETLHHVHADDVAQVFFNAINHRNAALGESFHAVGAESITFYGYAVAMYRFFGQQPAIKFLPWDEWCSYTKDEGHIETTYYHMARSGHFSIEKGKRLINYRPKYTPLETIEQSVAYMVAQKWLDKE